MKVKSKQSTKVKLIEEIKSLEVGENKEYKATLQSYIYHCKGFLEHELNRGYTCQRMGGKITVYRIK